MPLRMFSRRKRLKGPPENGHSSNRLIKAACSVALAAIGGATLASAAGGHVVHVTETVSANFTPVAYDLPSLTPQGVSISAELASERHFPHTHDDPYVPARDPQGGVIVTGTTSTTNDLPPSPWPYG